MTRLIIYTFFFIFLFSCKKNPNPANISLPSSNNILYTRTIGSYGGTTGSAIYSCNDTAGNQKLFLDSKTAEFAFPAWAGNDRIYFVGRRYNNDDRHQIYNANTNDGSVKRISNNTLNSLYSDIDISQSASRILYTKTGDVQFPQILCTNNLEGTDEKEIIKIAENTSIYPRWHQGDRIVFQSAEQLNGQTIRNVYQVNADGSGKKKITNNNGPAKSYDNFYLSPDGKKIAYTSPSLFVTASDVYISDLDGTNELKIKTSRSSLESWSNGNWSSDGKKLILYFTQLRRQDQLQVYNIDDASSRYIAEAWYNIDASFK